MAKAKPSFETMMTELAEIVNRLEQGELPLDEAIASYSAGLKLAAACRGRLEEAEAQLNSEGEAGR